MKKSLIIKLFLLIFFSTSSVIADPVSNVRYYQVSDKKITIYYDLSGSENLNVTVKVSLDGGDTFSVVPTDISGDIGEGIGPGFHKRIIWNNSADNIELSDDVVIKVLVPGDVPVEPSLPAKDRQKSITARRILSPVKLDGLSDETAWENIEPLPVVMHIPLFGKEPSERTEILLAYDDNYLYAAGRLYDSQPAKIHSTTMNRDDWNLSSDYFGIIIDTFNDNENALAFITTPAGQRIDMTVLEGAQGSPQINTSWNTFWDVATVQNGDGWFTEMRIPFSSLRFQERDGRVIMSFIANRWIARNDEMVIFPAIPSKWESMSYIKPSQAQEVMFEGIKSRKPLYVTPYVLGGNGRSYDLNDAGTAYKRIDNPAREAGLDIKYGLTSNLTLDVTLNTDFAQVEADDQQVNLTRYSLFFPEKRLFFQERASTFDFNLNMSNRLFHSRRIGIHKGKQVRIYGGARLVGRIGPYDLGFLSMQTEPLDELPSENFSVVRARRQVINPNSYVGGIVTSRTGVEGTYNTAYGIDGVFRLFGDDFLKIHWAQTFENDSDNNPLSLKPSKIYTHWERRSIKGFAYGIHYARSGDEYNPGMGFEMYDNHTQIIDFVRYGFSPGKESGLLRHIPYFEHFQLIRNIDNSTESYLFGPGWTFTTKTGYIGRISLRQYFEDVQEPFSLSDNADVPAGKYTFYGAESSFSTPSGGLFSIKTSLTAGSFYDGDRITFNVSPTQSISSNLELSGTYQLNQVRFPDRNQEFIAHIGRFRVLAMLSTTISVTSFIQYNSAIDTIIANIRFRYNPREGNDLYLVYDEGLNTNRYRDDPVLPVTSNRTVLLKYRYTFNL